MSTDLREVPIYGITEAAGYVHIPVATLRAWTLGRKYRTREGSVASEPLIRLPDPAEARLSFSNLVEAHVLRALRTRHDIPMRALRQALTFAEQELGLDRLLLREELLTAGGEVFLERYGELISLTRSGQIAVRKLLEAHLRRVERGHDGLPHRLFPFLTGDPTSSDSPIMIDPEISYGRPTIVGKGISTEAIVRRIDAGESIEAVADDYDLTRDELEAAVLYERAA